ncbi:TonB-dependent siderophore receptor [Horticoccus sp. 23ND18S-11]|uniref:TonB-dependent siderophore receptor n=1 Tax=Horticoccus sp. 23ND18S-11 TaxID=3391832 RepID=UPI0039C911EC
MNTTPMPRRIVALATLLTLPASLVFAQPKTAASDETIKLSEFNVSAERASGYRAQSAITATGFGANILDVPVTINVLTGEFVADVGGSLQSEVLRYVPGVITNPNYESYINIRGFSGLQSYRNGQYRRQLYSTWGMDRIEVIKGSSSIFFGLVRPGGVVNYITKKPSFKSQGGDARVTFGSWDFKKGELNYNYGGEAVAARIGVGAIDSGGWRNDDFKKEHYLGGSVSWKVFKDGLLSLDLETVRRVNQDRESAAVLRTNSRYYGNPAAIASGLGARAWLNANGLASTPTFDIFAPVFGGDDPYGRKVTMGRETYSFYESYTADLEYTQKIGSSLVYQLQFNFAIDDFEILRSIGGDQEPFADGTVRFRFGNFANYRDSYNFDNKFTYRLALGDTNHTISFGQESQRVYQDTPGWYDTAGRFQDGRYGAFAVWNPRTQPLRNAAQERAASPETWNIMRRRAEKLIGYYVGVQSEFLGGRLRTIVGGRRNEYTRNSYYERSVGNPEGATPKAKATTPLYGALFKFTPTLSGFAMYSESLEPQLGADADGRGLDPVTGKGYDIGLKSSLLNGSLAGSVSFYGVKREDLSSRDSAREVSTGRQPWFIYGDAEESQGIEVDLSYNPMANWQIMFGYSHATKAETVKSTTPARVGLPLAAFPKDVLSIWTKYDVRSGALNGWSFGGGLRDSSSVVFVADQNLTAKMPAYTTVDAMVQYRFKFSGRDVQAQVNVKNIFDKEYREGSFGAFGDPRSFLVSLSTKF